MVKIVFVFSFSGRGGGGNPISQSEPIKGPGFEGSISDMSQKLPQSPSLALPLSR